MQVEFFFDFSCPYAYLGSTQIEAVAARCGATVVWKPMLLGGVFRSVGTPQNMSEGMPHSKARHNLLDMQRWSRLWQVALAMPPQHPMRTVAALRALLAIENRQRWSSVIHEIYTSYWVNGEDVSEGPVLRRALGRAGLGEDEIERAIAANDDPQIKNELRERTDEAIERGVFGAPAMFVGDDLYWGQDRLRAVERALGGSPTSDPAPKMGAPVPTTIDFFYDFSSPFAYLASTEIEQVAEQAGATLRWKPFLLGALFKSLGTANVPILAFSPSKQRYYRDDLLRWAKARELPFSFSKHFPLRTVTALRVALLAGEDAIARLSHAIYAAVWNEQSTLDDKALRSLVAGVDLDPGLVDRANESESKAALFAMGSEAIERGVFGAPTIIVRREGKSEMLFWGQDRLDLVERAASGWDADG